MLLLKSWNATTKSIETGSASYERKQIFTARLKLFSLCALDYLCEPQANVYNIDFTRFKIRDMETGDVLFEIAKPDGFDGDEVIENDEDPNAGRFVRYKFTAEFLRLKTVGAT